MHHLLLLKIHLIEHAVSISLLPLKSSFFAASIAKPAISAFAPCMAFSLPALQYFFAVSMIFLPADLHSSQCPHSSALRLPSHLQ